MGLRRVALVALGDEVEMWAVKGFVIRDVAFEGCVCEVGILVVQVEMVVGCDAFAVVIPGVGEIAVDVVDV